MEVEDKKTGEVDTKFKGGSANAVPSDYVPNYREAVTVERPAA